MMNKNTEVLIIGAGLSGLMAAAKAGEQGRKVILVAKGMGALSLSSGCIDLWGYDLDQPERVCQQPLAEIYKMIATNREHPYAKVRDVLEESLGYFQQICRSNLYPYLNNNSSNWILPTALGTLRPTYLAPASMAVDSLVKAHKILVVGFRELKDFYPEVLAANLKKSGVLKANCELSTINIGVRAEELSPNTLAHRLEQPNIIDKVVVQVKSMVSPEVIALFPPVLGENSASNVVKHLSNALGCPVYEVANIPPSLPGQRLQQLLLKHIKARGVEVIIGCNITGAQMSERHCTQVVATGCGKSLKISAKKFVLATGSFLGGGLESRPGEVRESIFDLPVKINEEEWSAREFLSMKGQPFSKFGIVVNDRLQPVDEQGQVIIDNVMVVGANLAACNYPIEKCGNGVALATGYKAGQLAWEV